MRWVDFDPATGELAADGGRARCSPSAPGWSPSPAPPTCIGTRPDVPAIAALVHEAGALLYVDGVHLTAHAPVDVAALGADFFVCSPYKFLGPHCGVLAGRPGAAGDAAARTSCCRRTDVVPERFELGTLPYELLAGTTAAVDFLADARPTATATAGERLLASMAARRGARGPAARPGSRPGWPRCPA